MFDFREQILCGFEDDLSVLLCIYSVDRETFELHELNSHVSGGQFSLLLCIHSEDIEMFVLHELILYVFEDYLSL